MPQYTPPELQSQPFKEIRRTQQHDAFGLAVLILHLLFLGRHPFAGIFRQGTADKTIEDANREFRFGYSGDRQMTEMEPPPFIPPLMDLPAELSRLFVRAFDRNGAIGGRPLAAEWVAPLSKVIKSLKRRPANEAHHLLKYLSACPSCQVEKAVKIPMFGLKLAIVKGPDFDLFAVWAQIESIRPVENGPSPLFLNAVRSQCTPSPRIAAIEHERIK